MPPQTASGEQNGEQIQLLIIQGIQPPTGLKNKAKNKAYNWKVYKQQWENYSIVAQLAKQTKEYRAELSLLDRTHSGQDVQ